MDVTIDNIGMYGAIVLVFTIGNCFKYNVFCMLTSIASLNKNVPMLFFCANILNQSYACIFYITTRGNVEHCGASVSKQCTTALTVM